MILEDVILGFGLGFFSAIALLVIREIIMAQISVKKIVKGLEIKTDEKTLWKGKGKRGNSGDRDKARNPDLP